MRHVDFLVAVTSLSLWAFILVACVLGYVPLVAVFARSPLDTDTIYRLYATWGDHLDLFTVFCFDFLCHWVLDLASTLAFFVVPYQRDIHPSSEVRLGRGLEPGCAVPVHFMVLIVTVRLCHRGLWVPSLFNPLSNASNRPLRRTLRNVQLPPYPSLTLPTFVLTHTNNIQSEGPVPFHARPPLALQTQIQNLSQAPPTRPPLATNKHPDCEDRPRLGPVLRLVLLKRLVQHRLTGLCRVRVCDQVPLAMDDAVRPDRREFESNAGAGEEKDEGRKGRGEERRRI